MHLYPYSAATLYDAIAEVLPIPALYTIYIGSLLLEVSTLLTVTLTLADLTWKFAYSLAWFVHALD